MLSVKQLGHVGIYCTDLQRSKEFYTGMLGLTVTDEDPDGDLIFLSAKPEEEHHEIALCPGRDIPPGAKVIQQVSFIVEDISTLKAFYRHLKENGVRFRSVVSHGISIAIYFYDPDDNVLEVYAKTSYRTPQPYIEDVDLTLTEQELLTIAEASLES